MTPATLLLQHVRHLATTAAVDGPTDRELLRRFTHERDEQAFAALFRRHGPMVWSACRRTLPCASDAEDVLQATFLLLARKGATLRDHDAVGSWLFGVAHRLALRTRSAAALRSAREALAPPRPLHDPLAEITLRETQQLFDEALARLPEKCRAVLVLCCLEGLSQEEAARQLGCSRSTLKRRLEEGRTRLRKQLVRHGLALSAAFLAARLAPGVSAAMPASLTASVLRAAAGGPVSRRVARLAAGGATLFVGKLRGMAALMLALVVTIGGIACIAPLCVTDSPAKESASTAADTPPAAADAKPRVRFDRFDDPLPDGAVARIGTTRFRHGHYIHTLSFTADGKRLLSHGLDSVRAWDAATGRELRHLAAEAGTRFVWASFSPDGKLAATTQCDESGIVKASPFTIWDLATGKKVKALGGATYCGVWFAPNGRVLAAARYDQVVEIWDLVAEKKLASWRAHEGRGGRCPSLTFTQDGKVLMTASTDKAVCFWEAATGKKLRGIDGVVNTHGSLALSPDGKLIASVDHKESPPNVFGGEIPLSRIRILDTANGKVLRHFEIPATKLAFGQLNAVRLVALSVDGKTLAGVASDGLIHLWDVHTGKKLIHIKSFAPTAVAFSPGGKTLAVATWGNVVHLYDVASGKELPRGAGLHHPARSVGLTTDGRTLATPDGPSIVLWDPATGKPRRRLDGHETMVIGVLLSADGRRLISASADGTVRAWDVATGQSLSKLALDPAGAYRGTQALACSPDGKQVVVRASPVAGGAPLRLLDVATGETVRQINAGNFFVHGASFLPDGRSLVVWTGDRKARVWDVTTGKTLREVEYTEAVKTRMGPVPVGGGREEAIYTAAVSPDGRLIAFASDNDMIAVHDLAGGTEQCRVEKLPRGVGCLAFSPDGRTLAWGSHVDPRVHLLEVGTGKERQVFTGHRGGIVSLTYSADGRTLVSSGNDTTLLVWDLTLGGGALSAEEINARWNDLLTDAPRAYQAVRKLAASPAPVVEFLRRRIKPAAPADKKRIESLIAALDSDDFAVRQKAVTELEKLGDLAAPACRKALAGRPSLEAHRRLERLRKKQIAEARKPSAERVRLLRALEVLERAGSAEAREMLAMLAKGAPGAWLTEEAQAALDRLKR